MHKQKIKSDEHTGSAVKKSIEGVINTKREGIKYLIGEGCMRVLAK